jgi:hypothetical protein
MSKRPTTETAAPTNAHDVAAKPGMYPRSATELARLEEEGHDLSAGKRIQEASAQGGEGR